MGAANTRRHHENSFMGYAAGAVRIGVWRSRSGSWWRRGARRPD